MKTNDICRKIHTEALAECENYYPPNSKWVVQLRPNWRYMHCKILFQRECGDFKVEDLDTGIKHNFYPSCDPHRSLPSSILEKTDD